MDDIIYTMKKFPAFPNFIPLLLALTLLFAAVPTALGQALVSPTPDFDGNIYYMVQGNDTCLSISLKMGVEIETLFTMRCLCSTGTDRYNRERTTTKTNNH